MTKEVYSVSKDVWGRKYQFAGNELVGPDTCVDDTWKRVAAGVAENEDDPRTWEHAFYNILKDFKFLPAGRIQANAGTGRDNATFFNCYVMNTIDDSIEGIFQTVKEGALTQKMGGGVGFDFSTIRPTGAEIDKADAGGSGPLSFMTVFDATCRTMRTAGQRRGAQMGVMRCDHPNIFEFIEAKRGNAAYQMFNLSVGITHKFMEAVINGDNWELVFDGEVYRVIQATELWDKIMKSTYDFAEPGFLLIDEMNAQNNLSYCEEIRTTNPCGRLFAACKTEGELSGKLTAA